MSPRKLASPRKIRMTRGLREYAAGRLTGWTAYDPMREFYLRRVLRRHGELAVREALGLAPVASSDFLRGVDTSGDPDIPF